MKKNGLPIKEHFVDLKRVKNSDKTRLGSLRLDKNENIIPLPAKLISRLKGQITSNVISSYPEVDRLYRLLAKHVGCKKENLYLSSGSDGAIKSVFEAFIEPKDKVLLLSPSYAMFYVYAKMYQARLNEFFFTQDLSVDVDRFIDKIKKIKPKLVCIANPNSPTGTIIKESELLRIIKAAQKQKAVILIDEAYYLFYPKTAAKWIKNFRNLVVARTFSKAFSLASARLGFAIGSQQMIAALHKTRPMYETNAFAVHFAEIMLDNMPLIKRNIKLAQKGKEYLQRQVHKLGFCFYKSYANFLLIYVGSKTKANRIAKALNKKNIIVKSGFHFNPLDKCIRVNIGTVEQMKQFVSALRRVI